ncbi:MAG: RNA polymerase sigma factor [Solirubrobacteraceae bacterium]
MIRRARTGDQDAFAELVEMHGARVYGALRRFGSTRVRRTRSRRRCLCGLGAGCRGSEERARLSTWLYRIAFNEAQRRLSRRGSRQAEPDPEGDDAIASLPESSVVGPEAQTLDHEFEQTLERALDQLPADWSSAVILRDLAGLSTQQAAEVTGVRQAAFKSRLHRGRMQLRTLLEPSLKLEEE